MSPEDLLRELMQTFKVEADEHLQTLNSTLLALELRPEDTRRQDLMQEAFRVAHSLKGAARAVGLENVEKLGHAMEDLLQKARDARQHLPADAFDVLYEALDGMGLMLDHKPVDADRLVSRLGAISITGAIMPNASASIKEEVSPPPTAPAAPKRKSGKSSPKRANDNGNGNHAHNHPAPAAQLEASALAADGTSSAMPGTELQPVPPVLSIPVSETTTPSVTPSPPSPRVAEPSTEKAEKPEDAPLHSNSTTDETIRVNVSKLDNLMAHVGELLVTRMNAEQRADEVRGLRHQLGIWPKVWRDLKTLLPQVNGEVGKGLTEVLGRYQEQFEALSQQIVHFDQRVQQDALRLNIIAGRIQDSVRSTRMVPFETIAPMLQRAVRDASRSENKDVIFAVHGGEVELDKKVLETLKDPLLHMLRNAVSHGIEAPSIRASSGKPAQGAVMVSVQQRGTEVRITVSDDGAGFDLARLREKAATKHGYKLDESATAAEIIELAFLPGVSTAKKVTEISGRGVGLDVVRQHLEGLQGRIEVDTNLGTGTNIHLIVPMTLAISRGLLVQVGSERYALPLLAVEKIVVPSEVFAVQGQTMLRVEGHALPLVSLAALLDRPGESEEDAGVAIIMAVSDQKLALLVSDVITEQELAVKPLGKPLQRVRNVAGVALLGDGKPIVVLNAGDLMRAAKGSRRQIVLQTQQEETEETAKTRILVVDDSITTRTLEKNILETAGYDVTTATDGEQAFKRLKESPFDLVVSDVEMPNMNGIDLTRTIRATSDFRDLPLILVTSLESKEDRERGMTAGANAYIVKRGFDQAELLRTVEQLVLTKEA